MSLYRAILVLVVTTLFCFGQAGAQERTVRVAVPAGPLVQLVQALAPAFQARTGIAVSTTELNLAASLPVAGVNTFIPFKLKLAMTVRAGSDDSQSNHARASCEVSRTR